MEVFGITYEECIQYLSKNPKMCATMSGWPPTKFLKVEVYRDIPLPLVFDLALKNKALFIPDFFANARNNWRIYDGGDTFGDINKIRF